MGSRRWEKGEKSGVVTKKEDVVICDDQLAGFKRNALFLEPGSDKMRCGLQGQGLRLRVVYNAISAQVEQMVCRKR